MDMQVNSAELASAAESLRKNVNDMNQILNDATSTINQTTSSWESAAAENLRSRYTALSGKFADFYDAINKYAKFLDNTASAYESADKKITSKADELLNSGYGTE